MINQKIVIASRSSKLAKAQTELVISKLNKAGFNNIKKIFLKSSGDKLKNEEFKRNGGKGLFTKEIDQLIIENKIDMGIHSAKDIPGILDKKLIIGAYLDRDDVRDVLITRDHNIQKITQLPKNTTLGTSSPRREAYIKYLRPDLKIVKIRGNIETRIKKVLKEEIFSIIIAKAGLNRLKKLNINLNITTIPLSQILPSPGQGAIAIMYKKGNINIKKLCNIIECKKTRVSLTAERALIKRINGDCYTPIAAYAKVKGKKVFLNARLFSNDIKKYSDIESNCPTDSSSLLGKQCADSLLSDLKKVK